MATLAPRQPTDSPAHRFLRAFEAGWKSPTFDSFLADFLPWMHPEVRGRLPLEPLALGHDGFREQFRRVFALFPDLRATVERASVEGEALVIDATLTATLGGRPFTWAATDRFTFEGERVTERVTTFNPVPLLVAILLRPRAWGVWWRSGVGPPSRRRRASNSVPLEVAGG